MHPLRVAFAGTFAARLAEPVQAHLGIPCDVIIDDEREIVSRLREIDVLVTLAFTRETGGAARLLNLVQVPGAAVAGTGRQDARHPRLWPDWPVRRPARARLRHDSPRDQTRRFSPGPSGRACARARRSRGRAEAG